MTNHKSIFIDSSSWISYIITTDSNHRRATSLFSSPQLKSDLFISTFIISEIITKIRKILGQKSATRLYKQLLKSEKKKRLTILSTNKDILDEAMLLLEKYPTPNTFSLTDATNIILCQKYKISTLFSFDKDFQKLKIPRLYLLP
ncbi:hypothetical protein A2773_06945 [Candidatus Gottesmanbacteria bacterium RIFCSPHIGHO2_01_FULL_39_10]|uniref:PIN domain-containing protein n=1 Tax=Candidatus Gottesmanbacteria bacterium RIFCSPHIGHO2_01_FULL_39_10 TaxID=1798375 RepID=A0A1F5ZQS7_9BACT|nr:MAG: hypothetical protein A2773_06945 [Candidatus Gottesmanbacteria bacterium RIFCSPHIGHO2_01_FULL_39_10]